jgi:hypothetical protein
MQFDTNIHIHEFVINLLLAYELLLAENDTLQSEIDHFERNLIHEQEINIGYDLR